MTQEKPRFKPNLGQRIYYIGTEDNIFTGRIYIDRIHEMKIKTGYVVRFDSDYKISIEGTGCMLKTYFNTFEEAKQYLLDQVNNMVEE